MRVSNNKPHFSSMWVPGDVRAIQWRARRRAVVLVADLMQTGGASNGDARLGINNMRHADMSASASISFNPRFLSLPRAIAGGLG